jgi:hypothetical protein
MHSQPKDLMERSGEFHALSFTFGIKASDVQWTGGWARTPRMFWTVWRVDSCLRRESNPNSPVVQALAISTGLLRAK